MIDLSLSRGVASVNLTGRRRVLWIVLGLILSYAASDMALAIESHSLAAKTSSNAQVRLGLKLTPFKRVVTRTATGKLQTSFVADEPLRHTLRARLNRPNHFFVGDWHIETKPLKWVRKSRHYEVELSIYRRYGAFGQLEENTGGIVLAGTLEPQADGIYVLYGATYKRLRDKFGSPVLDVAAGFSKAEPASGVALSKNLPAANSAAARQPEKNAKKAPAVQKPAAAVSFGARQRF